MRIVAISDQHGFLPAIPPCDLLIIAGDICVDVVDRRFASEVPELQRRWFDTTIRPWLEASPATHVVATWGNHDWCGEACDFSGDAPEAASAARLQILVDQQTEVIVDGDAMPPHPADSRQRLTIWATPWSNTFGYWAFMKNPRDIAAIYARIPEGIDILVSHQPPYGYGDFVHDHIGSRELLAAIDRIRPRAVICGHIHEGHGRYEHKGIPIYNVSVVDEFYQLVHPPTVIEI